MHQFGLHNWIANPSREVGRTCILAQNLGLDANTIHVLLTACGAEALGNGAEMGCRGSCEDMPLFAASLDFNTAFDVAKLNVMANVLDESRLHRGLISAFLKEMRNLQGLADFFFTV